eukprot:1143854-Pelagomonas_calceolata.AAC.3
MPYWWDNTDQCTPGQLCLDLCTAVQPASLYQIKFQTAKDPEQTSNCTDKAWSCDKGVIYQVQGPLCLSSAVRKLEVLALLGICQAKLFKHLHLNISYSNAVLSAAARN